MTVILKPSEVEKKQYLPPEEFASFQQELYARTRHLVQHVFLIGGGYSLGSDVDIVSYFDEPTSEQMIRSQHTIREVAQEHRLQHFDLIRLYKERDSLVGLESIHHIGPVMHMLTRIDDTTSSAAKDLKLLLQQEFDRRLTPTAFEEELAGYAAHKSVSLVEHASHSFDPENTECMRGLGKVLSYAGHAGRQLMRLATKEEPGSKADILDWAEQNTSEPENEALSILLREDIGYRTLLQSYAADPHLVRKYVRHLKNMHRDVPHQVVDFARNLRRRFSK